MSSNGIELTLQQHKNKRKYEKYLETSLTEKAEKRLQNEYERARAAFYLAEARIKQHYSHKKRRVEKEESGVWWHSKEEYVLGLGPIYAAIIMQLKNDQSETACVTLRNLSRTNRRLYGFYRQVVRGVAPFISVEDSERALLRIGTRSGFDEFEFIFMPTKPYRNGNCAYEGMMGRFDRNKPSFFMADHIYRVMKPVPVRMKFDPWTKHYKDVCAEKLIEWPKRCVERPDRLKRLLTFLCEDKHVPSPACVKFKQTAEHILHM